MMRMGLEVFYKERFPIREFLISYLMICTLHFLSIVINKAETEIDPF